MMNLRAFCNTLTPKYWRELARLFRNHKWERNDDGEILISHATIGGVFECDANDGLGVVITRNKVMTEGMNYLLSAGIAGGTVYTTFYVAPFSNNVDPVVGLTAATFSTTQAELTTEYSETTRVAFVESTPSGGGTNNTASPATITAATDSVSIWGLGLISATAKSATTGVLLAASKYSTVRTLPTASDTLGIKYTLTLANSV